MIPQAPQPAFDRGNLLVRVASAAVFAVFFLAMLYFGDHPLAKLACLLLLMGASFMGVRELCLMGAKAGHAPSVFAGTLVAWLFLLHFYFEGGMYSAADPLPLWLVLTGSLVIVHLGNLLFRKDPVTGALTDQALTWMSGLLMGIGMGFMLKLFMFGETTLVNTGGRLLFTLVFIVWIGDSAAYFAGSFLGRHKLAPKISPKKSWEGVIGNLAGNVAAGFFVRAFICPEWSALDAVVVGLLLGSVGILGDLAESAWKRSVDLKDSAMGLEIPGHGGMLDRVDSLLFAAPVLYVYIHYVKGLT